MIIKDRKAMKMNPSAQQSDYRNARRSSFRAGVQPEGVLMRGDANGLRLKREKIYCQNRVFGAWLSLQIFLFYLVMRHFFITIFEGK